MGVITKMSDVNCANLSKIDNVSRTSVFKINGVELECNTPTPTTTVSTLNGTPRLDVRISSQHVVENMRAQSHDRRGLGLAQRSGQ